MQLGRYTLTNRLGHGGGGEVWEALLAGPVGFRKRVAIKLGPPNGATDEALLREARFGALLRHPNVVDVYELGETPDGRFFLAMELVPGPSLGLLMRRHGPLPGPALREIAIQVASGLGHIHAARAEDGRGLVHRDVKPTNVLLDPSGAAKVSDLGIARLAGAAVELIEGTPGYLAPEQLGGRPPDPRADVFSFGMVLWAMAAGTNPLRPGTDLKAALTTALGARSSAQAARPVLERALPGLADLVSRCLDPDPVARFADGNALASALRALPEPRGEGLVEVLARRATATTSTPPAAAERTTRLRPEESPLLGRTSERDALIAQLANPGVVCLKGLAGIGKSRLAQHVAHRWFREGRPVAWADPPASRDAVVPAVATALGIALGAGDPVRQVALALRHRPDLLLVLDGFDAHPADLPELLRSWRAEAADLRVLVTARAAVRDVGEVVVELGPLATDDAVALLRERLDGRTDPRTAVVRVARALGHHPLAIELAAARARAAPERDLADAVGGAGPDALASAVAATWSTLPAWGRRALLQLAVFRGTFTVEAAGSVIDLSPWPDAPWPLDAIDELWRRSLLHVRQSRTGPRLGMYESVQAHVLAETDPDVIADAELRHGRWFARFGDPSWLEGLGTRTGEERARELARDLEDIVAACDRALRRGDLAIAESAALAAVAILVRRGPHSRGEALVRAVLAAQGDAPSDLLLLHLSELGGGLDALDAAIAAATHPRRRAFALARRIRWLAVHGQPGLALEDGPDALAEAVASGALGAQGEALVGLGIALRTLGRPADAEARLREAAERFVALGDVGRLGSARMALGNVLNGVGRTAEARAEYVAAQEAARATGNRSQLATALSNESMVVRYLGDTRGSEARAREAIGIARELGDPLAIANALGQLAAALGDHDREEEVLALSAEAAGLQRRHDYPLGAAYTLTTQAAAARNLGRFEEAERIYVESAALAWSVPSPRAAALAVGNHGSLLLDLGRHDAAATALDEAITLSRNVADGRFEGFFVAERARVELARGRDPGDRLARARPLLERTGTALDLAMLSTTEGLDLVRLGRLDDARALLDGLPALRSAELDRRRAALAARVR